MEKSIEFEKKVKGQKKFLILGVVFLLMALSSILTMYFSYKKDMDNAANLIDVKTENKYAKVDASLMTDYFAESDYNGVMHRTYFVFDENDNGYIIDISEENRKKLKEIYDYSYNDSEDAKQPKVVNLKGMTKRIPDDLKRLAISAYNKMYGENLLNSANFSQYFGNIYLDTYDNPMTNFSFILICALPFIIIGIIFLINYFKGLVTTKKNKEKYQDKWDMVLKEIDETDLVYKKAKLYLTKSYIISYQNGLEIYDYNDIVWVYPHEYRYNGSVTQKSVFVVTKDSKAHKLATLSTSKKNRILFDELYNTLMNKMPEVLKGYTKENIKLAKEMYVKK